MPCLGIATAHMSYDYQWLLVTVKFSAADIFFTFTRHNLPFALYFLKLRGIFVLHIDQGIIQHEYTIPFVTTPKTAGSKHVKSALAVCWMQSMFRVH